MVNFAGMGNAANPGRNDGAGSSGANQASHFSTPQVPIVPIGRPQIQIDEGKEMVLRAVITWIHGGFQVFVKGSWDDWRQEEPLLRSGRDFNIVKELNPSVYHYIFNVDGKWVYAPELPVGCDEMGNMFNVLDLQGYIPEVPSAIAEPECPSSPISSYDNAPFTLEDNDMKSLPELPPLLRQTPLDQPLTFNDASEVEAAQKPLSAVLNHLYIQKGDSGRSSVALSSTQRFRTNHCCWCCDGIIV